VAMNKADFELVRTLVKQRSAIVLEDGKEYLADARLTPLARRQGLASVEDLVQRLRAQPRGDLQQRVVEAMTTNETSFFRDVNPFEALRKQILPDLLSRRAAERALNIWCGASSTGQEPYSLLILIREYFPQLTSWKINFVASDLSTDVLERARQGKYSQLEVNRGLPAALLVKYFTRHGAEYRVRDDLRAMVDFRMINLVERWPNMPPLDLVMLRNVLIYFDVETKKAILNRIRRLLRPDAYLLLGGAETTINLDDHLEQVRMDKFTCCRLRES
jgi:chemotaxis protein methyltransferase CheR